MRTELHGALPRNAGELERSGTATDEHAGGHSAGAEQAARSGTATDGHVAPMRAKIDTLRPPLTDAAAPPPAAAAPAAQGADPSAADGRAGGQRAAPGSLSPGLLPPPTQPLRRSFGPFDDEGPSVRFGPPSSGDDPFSVPRRRNVGGWIVTLVLLLAVGVVGWAIAKPYFVAKGAGAAAQLDPRLATLLSEGERAMNEGMLDVAQGDFDKASVLAEKDPRVLLDEARIAACEADVPWLKLRLLSPDAIDEVRTTTAQLDEILERERRFASDALAVAPDDVGAARAKIDALRLAGERDAARAYVSKVIGQGSQPETAYVLAALDLAEPVPLWTTIVDRLRIAAGAESRAGRAQAALIYALAKSGDVGAAKVELAKFEAAPRPYPLLASLHDFVERASAVAGPASVARSNPSTKLSSGRIAASGGVPAGSGAGPTLSGIAAAPAAPAVEPARAGVSTDPRLAMQSAAQALKRADFAGARDIYQSIVDRNPKDSEAIAGLGDVARLQGDSSAAVAAYTRAIAVNPSYLPALLGLADTEWGAGDRAAAIHTYGDIVDRFPEGTYPRYVPQRAAEGSTSGGSTAEPSLRSPSAAASSERAE